MTQKAKHPKHPKSASNSVQMLAQKPVRRLPQSKRIKKSSAEKKPRSALSANSDHSKTRSELDHSVTTEEGSNSSLLDIIWETPGQIYNFFRKTFQRRPDGDMPQRHSLPPRLAGRAPGSLDDLDCCESRRTRTAGSGRSFFRGSSSSVLLPDFKIDAEFLTLKKTETPTNTLQFSLIQERELPFLNEDSEVGQALRESLIEADMDDDVATDTEMAHAATCMLERQLRTAIESFV